VGAIAPVFLSMVAFRAICSAYFLVWVIGDPGNANSPALEIDEEEHVIGYHASPRKDLHCEVRPRQQREVSSKTREIATRARSDRSPYNL